ncbi:unnamed protein product, partial [Plutella xylostella]
MAPVNVPCYNKWNRPPTSVYEDNYGYGINFYQPMIDYINAKEQGIHSKPPHLPWNNERGLEKYRFDKPIRAYSQEDVNRISHDISEQAKRDLNDFRVAKRSAFSVVQTAAAANVSKHVGAESVTVKNKKKKVDREKIKTERQKKRMEEIEREVSSLQAEMNVGAELRGKAATYRGKSANAIAQSLLDESRRNISDGQIRHMDSQQVRNILDKRIAKFSKSSEDLSKISSSSSVSMRQSQRNESSYSESFSESMRSVRATSPRTCIVRIHTEIPIIDDSYLQRLHELKQTLAELDQLNMSLMFSKSKQTSIEIEQLNARVVEAETKLKTEITRIKKKLQIQITELELSLDVANKTNIDLQKTIKKQSLQLTEIQSHYDEVQRQLQVTLDQYGVAQRRIQSLTGEVEEIRGNYEQALRAKR